MAAHAHRSSGFVLIEVLISVLIFAVGVLALVGLQVNMTRAQTESKIRADATNLANELIGVIWSDSNNLGNYNTNVCTGQCASWKSKVALVLPSGNATLAADNASGVVNIGITWTTPGGGGQHNFTTATTVVRNPP